MVYVLVNTIKPKEKTYVQMFHNEESLLSEFVTIKLTFEIYFLTRLNGTDETPQKICSIDCFLSSVKFFFLLCNIYESRSSSPPQFGGWNLRQIADVLVVYVM